MPVSLYMDVSHVLALVELECVQICGMNVKAFDRKGRRFRGTNRTALSGQ